MHVRLIIRLGAALALMAALALAACGDHSERPAPMREPEPRKPSDVRERFKRIEAFLDEHGLYDGGGREVLQVARNALIYQHKHGRGHLVGIEDLWAHALQEGQSLFDDPSRLWGPTGADATGDMIGQTTIGPWQMTIANIRNHYGLPYGVKEDWSDARTLEWCRKHPEAQAKMIIDYIQDSYEQFGVRTPYAIQRYFWLDPYVRGEIGKGDWWESPVAKSRTGSWSDLTAEEKAATGFYAKQVLLGAPYTKRGLLFWLYVSGDRAGAREAIRAWRDQATLVRRDGYERTDETGAFALDPRDVRYMHEHPDIRAAIMDMIYEVNREKKED